MSNDWKDFLTSQGAVFSGDSVHDFGDYRAELIAAGNSDVLADLSHLDRLSISGADAEDFLQGQLSNDIRLLNDANSQFNTYCNPKGRMLALFRVLRSDNGFILISDHNIGVPLMPRLKMFVMRSRVEIKDIAADQTIIGVSGNKITQALGKTLEQELPTSADETVHINSITVICLQGSPGRYLLVGESEPLRSLWTKLAQQFTAVGRSAWERLDIQSGIPSVHGETSEAFIPQMLNLDVLNALNFKKGCYPGQEIIARMKYLGKLKQRMFLGYSDSDTPDPGDGIFAQSFGTQKAGTVVNAQPNPENGSDFLFVCQIKAVQNDELHLQTAEGPVIKLLELPYDLPLDGNTET